VVIERGLAEAWDLRPGSTLEVSEFGPVRVAGIAVSPDNVAFPLAKTARIYMGAQEIEEEFPGAVVDQANIALLWLVDRDRQDVTLAQARATSFGVGDLRFITRSGVQIAVGQAAGIVIALLIAFSAVALVAAGTMLAAGADAEVRRQLPGIGVQRTLGYTPGRIAAGYAGRAARIAAPAAAVGLALGALVVAGPTRDLLAALNQQPPGWSLLVPLALAWMVVVALVCLAATWPALRAARGRPAAILRGGDLATHPPSGASSASFPVLGARFATAHRARFAAAVATVGACAGVVALMLALASLLEALRDDPATLGRKFALTVQPDASLLPAIRRVPGVSGASERYVVEAADSFRLGEPVQVIAYPGDHVPFEAPPLESGRRLRTAAEVEVGAGLADALGLRPGSRLALQLPTGEEARFRVAGVVQALERDGRVAYARPDRLGAVAPSAMAITLDPGADRERVSADLRELGVQPVRARGAAPRDGTFLVILAAVLRGVALAVGLVCLYGLVQAVAMTARERRGTVAVLRASGADAREVLLLLGGTAAAVAVPAAVLALLAERFVFAPLVERLAAGFADLPLALSTGQAVLVLGGLALLALAATAVVARRVLREPVVRGLREG
jgi:ABC-type lipoprotein release transport system permease subunit